MGAARYLARLRDRPVLSAQIAALRMAAGPGHHSEDVTAAFQHGALDALVWVTKGGPTPLTGVMTGLPVPLEMIVDELATTEDLIYGRPSRHQDYARGVQHALMWAQFATPAPPLPPPAPGASSRNQPAPGRGIWQSS